MPIPYGTVSLRFEVWDLEHDLILRSVFCVLCSAFFFQTRDTRYKTFYAFVDIGRQSIYLSVYRINGSPN